VGAGEGRRKLLNDDNLVSGRGVRSGASGRGVAASGAGEEGRLVGRKKDGALIEFIIVYNVGFGGGRLVFRIFNSRVGSILCVNQSSSSGE
jgi:hypothetical protein